MIRKFTMASAVLIAATASALAADLPSRRPPPPVFVPPALFTWTGIYVGGDIGYGWGTDKSSTLIPAPDFASSTPQGVVGGGHIGYNYQVSQFVLGIEGDVLGTNFRNNSLGVPSGTTYAVSLPIEASVRGRVGYAWDRVLFYATGGVAFGNINNSYFGGLLTPGTTFSRSTTKTGYTVGGGIEYALSNNWSVRGEYRYTDFGRKGDVIFGTGYLPTHRVIENKVTLGVSYKFDWYTPPAPVVAKY